MTSANNAANGWGKELSARVGGVGSGAAEVRNGGFGTRTTATPVCEVRVTCEDGSRAGMNAAEGARRRRVVIGLSNPRGKKR